MLPPAMRWLAGFMFLLFVAAMVVQLNDPDPGLWIGLYGVVAALSLAAFLKRRWLWPTALVFVIYAAFAIGMSPSLAHFRPESFTAASTGSVPDEEVREALGLIICALWTGALTLWAWRGRKKLPALAGPASLVVGVFWAVACASHGATDSASVVAPQRQAVFSVPVAPVIEALPRRVIATGLQNPRGMLWLDNGSLLVAVAGSGDPASPLTGALLKLDDKAGDGFYDNEGDRTILLDEQPSANILDIVRRDEVFGMAGMAAGRDSVLVSLAFFGGRSTLFRVDAHAPTNAVEWGNALGNINDLTYDPSRDAWFGVNSSSDEVVQLQPGRGTRRVVKIPPLPSGQDPVPGYIRHDPATGDLLVSLFSGSTEGEEGGDGTELVARAGGIVRVNPDTGELRWVVAGLTAPTDFEVSEDGTVYVLEFCDAFEDPITTRAAMWGDAASHGGFRRFSGRLLSIEPKSGDVRVIAAGLDAPTNLALKSNRLLIAQGMGTPGRKIPGPDGSVPLTGYIEELILPGAKR